GLGESNAGDLRVGVDRARDPAVVDDGVVAESVLGRHLALAESRVRELPVTGAVAYGVDVLDGRAPALVGRDALALVELDADRLQAEALDEGPATDGNEHQIGAHGLAVAEMNGQLRAGIVDLGALLLALQGDAALAAWLRELLRGVRVLLRAQRRQHLDDRHFAAE